MKFDERLRFLREKIGLTQMQLAEKSGISVRMIQKYEAGVSRPGYDASEKLAVALGISVSELLCDSDTFALQAKEQYGSGGAKQATRLLEEVTGLFAGGEMAQEDMDTMLKAIQDAYWIAKEKNKKYGKKGQ